MSADETKLTPNTIQLNIPNETLEHFKKAFHNLMEALISDKREELMSRLSLELRIKVFQHMYDLAVIVDRMIFIGGLAWSEDGQKELAVKWAELAEKIVLIQ